MYNNYNDKLYEDLRDFEEYMKEQREKENKRQESEKINNETEKH